MSQKKYDTVIFDLDGTLLNTLDDLTDAVNFALDRCGCQKRSREEVKLFVGNGAKKLMERALPEGFPDSSRAFTYFTRYYSLHYSDKTRPYRGMQDLVDALRQSGRRVGILSNKPNEIARKLCDIYFPGVPTLGQTGTFPLKPHPAALTYMMKYFESSFKETIFVGDSKVDQQTARAAFTDCAIVRWGFGSVFLDGVYSPQVFVNTPEQLREYLLGK